MSCGSPAYQTWSWGWVTWVCELVADGRSLLDTCRAASSRHSAEQDAEMVRFIGAGWRDQWRCLLAVERVRVGEVALHHFS